MDWTSAPIIEDAPLEPAHRRFLPAWIFAVSGRIEEFLEGQRAQLPLWLAVTFGAGIAAWLWLAGTAQWAAFIALWLSISLTGISVGRSRTGRALLLGGLSMAAGCALILANARLEGMLAITPWQVRGDNLKLTSAKLKAANGNISKAAREAGVDRSNFKRLLREYGVLGDGSLVDEQPET